MVDAAQHCLAPLWDYAQSMAQQPAMVWRDGQLSWQDLAAAVQSLAAEWRGRGLQAGQRVVLEIADGPRHVIEALAVIASGGVHCPLDASLAPPQRRAALQSLAPHWQVVEDPGVPLSAADPALPGPAVCRGPSRDQGAALSPPGSVFIRHTSGTTGTSKGVVLSQSSVIGRADAAIAALNLQPGDAMMWVLPLAFHFAVSIGACLRSGTTVVFAASLRPSVSAQIAQTAAVTHAYLSPAYAARLAALPALSLGSRLRQVVVTTAAIDPVAADALRRRLGVPLRQALGVIEVGLPLISAGGLGEAAGAFGQPCPGYRVRIVDARGDQVAVGESGELTVAGPGLLEAYMDPWTPASAILRDGFFATGDAALCDEHGAVQLLGRLKSVVIIGGMKVFPLQVEAAIAAHPAVAHCRVSGEREGPLAGTERLLAEIQPHPTCAADEALIHDLQAHCRALLAPLEQPSRWRFTEFRLTPSGKVPRI